MALTFDLKLLSIQKMSTNSLQVVLDIFLSRFHKFEYFAKFKKIQGQIFLAGTINHLF